MSRHCRVLKFILVGLVCVSLLPVKVHLSIRRQRQMCIRDSGEGTSAEEYGIYSRTSLE